MIREGLAPAEAAAMILADAKPLLAERTALPGALNRVLAESVRSPVDIPPWDNSAMDGYALRSADVVRHGTGVTLRIVETIAAGQFPLRTPGPGECSRIFTGAPLPGGCDCVIRQEDTTPLGDDAVRINDLRDAGKNLRHRGEDIRRDAIVFETGTVLGPAHLGVLASIGQRFVSTHRRPVVSLTGSGDEIVDLDRADEILAGRKVASSNTYTLAALLHLCGADTRNAGIARDDPAHLRAILATALAADVALTTAGVSVGDHDHVRSVLGELGVELRFWRIRMRPGAPVGYGVIDGRQWIGLPGNPVSAMVTFELLVRPLIRKLSGHSTFFRRPVTVSAGERIVLGPRLQHFLRVVVTEADGRLVARLTGPQGSGILTSMAKANALLIVPEDKAEVAVGELLPAIRLDETVHMERPPF